MNDILNRKRCAVLGALLAASLPAAALAKSIYLSPSGSDTTGVGSLAAPYATFTKAYGAVSAGDTIFARGGTYNLSAQFTISKAGTAALPYTITNYGNEVPVLNFAAEPSGKRGIQIDSNYWTIRGLTVQNAKDNGVIITGSNNTLDRLLVHDNQDSGIQISQGGTAMPSNNLVVNTDSYHNYDPANHGENADGFAIKFRGLGTNNVLRGVRAFANSDDGFDFWEAENGVTVENSWSFKNGFNIFGDTAWAGDGNGLKLGHDSGTHLLKGLAVWGNRLNGIDVNGNATGIELPDDPITHGVTVENVTAWNNGAGGNGYNFNFDESYPHVIKNNISFQGGSGGANSANIFAGNVADHNTWNGIGVTAADFLSLVDTIATGPRNPDGSLPITSFLRLASNSHLINAGTNVGLPFTGSAPDLGAFEYGIPTPGDMNVDGVVNFTDLLAFSQHYGTATGATWLDGDFDFNGTVDFNDLLALSQNYNPGAASGFDFGLAQELGSGVPEPTALAGLLGLACVALGRRRSTRGSVKTTPAR